LYEVDFEDGQVGTYAANVIVENINEQVDEEGQAHVLFDSIIDHKQGLQVLSGDNALVKERGKTYPRRSTKGWILCVQWKDGSMSLLSLNDLKELHPVKVAEYATVHKLMHEPAIAWWVPQVLRNRDCLIDAVKSCYLHWDQKFVTELPHTVKHALEIERKTGTIFWIDAIRNKMKTLPGSWRKCSCGSSEDFLSPDF
jgi:hypothetical protein